jgi:hypothetical protein
LELKFNQSVDPADLVKKLSVASDPPDAATANPKFHVVTKSPGSTLLIRCSRPKANRLRIELPADLVGQNAQLALGEPVIRHVDLPPLPFVSPASAAATPKPIPPLWLLRADAQPVRGETPMQVSLQFTTSLREHSDLRRLVRITPAVEATSVWIDGRRLCINGPFEHGRRYTATVSDELLGTGGERLSGSQSITFEFPDRDPTVRFPYAGGILSPHGYLLLDVETVNVAGLELSAARVHANNLVQHLRGEFEGATARKLNGQTLRIEQPEKNFTKTTTLDLRQWLEQPLGIYHLRARAADHAWTMDDSVVTVTDLALTCKQERNGLVVWVTSLRTAQPAERVKVTSISYTNQPLATAITAI